MGMTTLISKRRLTKTITSQVVLWSSHTHAWVNSYLYLSYGNLYCIRFTYYVSCLCNHLLSVLPRVWPGYPLSAFAPPLFINFLIFCSLLPFPFSFSHPLYLFYSTVHLIPFYQNSPTLFPGMRS